MRGGAVVFVHLREDVADDLAFVVLRHMDELGPGEIVVHIVLQLIAVKNRIVTEAETQIDSRRTYFSGKHHRFEFWIWSKSSAVACRIHTIVRLHT